MAMSIAVLILCPSRKGDISALHAFRLFECSAAKVHRSALDGGRIEYRSHKIVLTIRDSLEILLSIHARNKEDDEVKGIESAL